MRCFSANSAARLRRAHSVMALLLCFGLSVQVCMAQPDLPANPGGGEGDASSKTEELDRVVAVVNSQVILASDLDFEIQLYRLQPGSDSTDATPSKALERLTTRALIEQQILQEDPLGMDVEQKELESNLTELRQNLAACKERDCATPGGWASYIATLGLTPARVDAYWSGRIAVLRFIEQRFRSGIRIAPEEIQAYYKETLLPQYAKPGDAPPLDRVSHRIEEVLLQRQVNALLNDWLKSLQDQGQVEVLDPSLQTVASTGETASPGKGGEL